MLEKQCALRSPPSPTDIPFLDVAINYSFPPRAKVMRNTLGLAAYMHACHLPVNVALQLFVHRVGRVARAGRSGAAISFVCPDELAHMVCGGWGGG